MSQTLNTINVVSSKYPIVTEVQRAEEWLQIIPKLRLLTLESEQDEADLHRRSQVVKIFGKELEQFCQAMVEHMHNERGIGLAAPQMGVFQRIFVSQTCEEAAPLIIVNPEIRPASDDKKSNEEGCLSAPGIYAKVERWAAIDIKAQDPYGQTFEFQLEGLDSICFQHENDHLDGILFTDYLKRSQVKKIHQYFAELRLQNSQGSVRQSKSEDDN